MEKYSSKQSYRQAGLFEESIVLEKQSYKTITFKEIVTTTTTTYTKAVEKDIQKVRWTPNVADYKHDNDVSESKIYSKHLNYILQYDDELVAYLPLDSYSTTHLFDKIQDGIILIRLLYRLNPRAFYKQTYHKRNLDEDLSSKQKFENVSIAINAAHSMGCDVSEVDVVDVLDGR
jgi:hypothetical protein